MLVHGQLGCFRGQKHLKEMASRQELRVAVSLQHSITLKSVPMQRAVARKRKSKANILPAAAAQRTKHESKPSELHRSFPMPCIAA